MKKLIFYSILFVFNLLVNAQTIIENPKFGTRTSSILKITKIEVTDTSTNIYFKVDFFPKWWITVGMESFIQPSNGGEKLYVKSLQGVPVKNNEKWWMPESGSVSYSASYPKLADTITSIDFYGGEKSTWKIFDIELKPQSGNSMLPEMLTGNWLKTDGSNEWIVGFFEKVVIYKNEFWEYEKIMHKSNKYEITLKGNNRTQKLLVQDNKSGGLKIGERKKQLIECSRTKVYNVNFQLENNKPFEKPLLKRDTAVYRGYIHGYSPKMGFKTGIIYVNDIFEGNQNSYTITISSNGTFEVKIPLNNQLMVQLKMESIRNSVFLEPGKVIIQFFDFEEYAKPYKTIKEYDKRQQKSLFMGNCARINSEIAATDSINYLDNELLQKKILVITPEQYKTWLLDIKIKEEQALANYQKQYPVSDKSLQLIKNRIEMRYTLNLLDFNSRRESVYRQKNKIPAKQKDISLEEIILDSLYLSDVRYSLNDPLSVYNDSYYFLINRVKYSDVAMKSIQSFSFGDIIPYILNDSIDFTEEEKGLLDKYENNRDFKDTTLVFKEKMKAFNEKYKVQLKNSFKLLRRNQRYDVVNQFFGANNFVIETMKGQDYTTTLKKTFVPLSEKEINEIKGKISNPFIVDRILVLNEDIKKKIINNKNKAGYVINNTPQTNADKLFDTMMAKYRGKVIYVDFWATWCSPCRNGIERIKPLKEEMKYDSVVFVYITNPSSPLETWQNFIPDVRGEHFRVSQDEWNTLSGKFNISGIPHYVLLNKKGEVINPELPHLSNEELKSLLKSEMDKKE